MRPAELEAVILLWHEACEQTYTFLPDRPRADRRRHFEEAVVPACDLWVALEGEAIAGFLALKDAYIDRLYVHPEEQRRGVGTALLEHARALHPDGLQLHTHQQNTGACAFYEKHGFRAVRYGTSPPPENAPDVEYHWNRA